MSDLTEASVAVVKELLRPLVEYVVSSDKRKTLKQAGVLRFWSDGMFKELKQIGKSRATTKTYQELDRKFRSTEASFETAMHVLTITRDKLGGGSVARAIDDCLNNDVYGKGTIRAAIEGLVHDRKNGHNPERARDICNQIEILNAALERLRRLMDE
jgi:hypothetical protein